jgi:hypothetical protein
VATSERYYGFRRAPDDVYDRLRQKLTTLVCLICFDSFFYSVIYLAHTRLAAAWAGLTAAHTPSRVPPLMQAKLAEVKAWYACIKADRAVELLEKDQSKLAHLTKTASTLKVKAQIEARLDEALSQRARARIEYDEAKAQTVKARNGL